MKKPIRMSGQTRANWLIDAAVALGGLLASVSGIYFLFLPAGREGGRNPLYNLRIILDREGWDLVHTWGGLFMIAAVVIHLAIHWGWVKRITRRVGRALVDRSMGLSRGAWVNVIVDAAVTLGFLGAAVSGVDFLSAPSGGFQGGANPNWDPGFLFTRTTWDLIHTWSGNTMIVAAVIHLAIHWRWVTNVTRRFFLSLWQRPAPQPAADPAQS